MSAVRRLVAADVAEYSSFIAADEVTRRSPGSADVQLLARQHPNDALPRPSVPSHCSIPCSRLENESPRPVSTCR
jgi:hypothetical protein